MSCEAECPAAKLISLFAKLQRHSAKLDLHPVMNLTSLRFLVSGDKYLERFLLYSKKITRNCANIFSNQLKFQTYCRND